MLIKKILEAIKNALSNWAFTNLLVLIPSLILMLIIHYIGHVDFNNSPLRILKILVSGLALFFIISLIESIFKRK